MSYSIIFFMYLLKCTVCSCFQICDFENIRQAKNRKFPTRYITASSVLRTKSQQIRIHLFSRHSNHENHDRQLDHDEPGRCLMPTPSQFQDTSSDNHTTLISVKSNVIIPNGVTLKMAFDVNNGVADASLEKSDRFTCSQSLDLVHRLRRCSDAVLVGCGTVERDDCTLTVRRVDPLHFFITLENGQQVMKLKQPTRVVIDPSLRILIPKAATNDVIENIQDLEGHCKYQILKDRHDTIIYHCKSDLQLHDEKNKVRINGLSEYVKLVRLVPENNAGSRATPVANLNCFLSPKDILKDLQSRGMLHVMVEGGPTTALSFLRERVVDRAIFIRTPLDFRQPVPSRITLETMRQAGLVLLGENKCGDDTVEYWSRKGMPWPCQPLEAWP